LAANNAANIVTPPFNPKLLLFCAALFGRTPRELIAVPESLFLFKYRINPPDP
jgi:hypothetical protein